MGTLISKPYDVTEGQEYAAYLDRVLGECRRLLREGRLPDGDGIVAFLDDAQLVLQCVRRDVAEAGASAQTTVRSELQLSKQEYDRYQTMGESILTLLQILEMREAVVLNRTESVARVADAFQSGEWLPA
jgi:hypothetical protein